MQPEEFLALPDDEQVGAWDHFTDTEKKTVLAHTNDQYEMERAAEMLARGVDPRELDKRIELAEAVLRWDELIAEKAKALAWAYLERLEGHDNQNEIAEATAAYRHYIEEFEASIQRVQEFLTKRESA